MCISRTTHNKTFKPALVMSPIYRLGFFARFLLQLIFQWIFSIRAIMRWAFMMMAFIFLSRWDWRKSVHKWRYNYIIVSSTVLFTDRYRGNRGSQRSSTSSHCKYHWWQKRKKVIIIISLAPQLHVSNNFLLKEVLSTPRCHNIIWGDDNNVMRSTWISVDMKWKKIMPQHYRW